MLRHESKLPGWALSSANIKVLSAPGTDPMSVVTCAEEELKRGGYDRAYCVFDRNGHANYAQALNSIAQSPNRNQLFAATSVPCFEVWVLLHFVFSTAPFTGTGRESACDRVLREVKRHFPNYTKGYHQTFDDLERKMERAIQHGMQLERHNVQTGSDNPATRVHDLAGC
jgi:hypothetical protein